MGVSFFWLLFFWTSVYGRIQIIGKGTVPHELPLFKLNHSEALQVSRLFRPFTPQTSPLSVKKAYLFIDELRPVWVVSDNTPHWIGKLTHYIDAETAHLLRTIPEVKHDQGYVFDGLFYKNTQPPLNQLSNVQPISSGGIVGRDFRSFQACSHYRCPNGTYCSFTETQCLDLDNQKQDFSTMEFQYVTNGRYLDLNRRWEEDGYLNGHLHFVWTKAPVFAPSLKKPTNGIWGSNLDFKSFNGLETTDAYAELQAYHYLSRHYEFMTDLMAVNGTFCLIGQGTNCSQVDPITNRKASPFTYPIPFVVNLGSPSTGSGPSIFAQIEAGKGKSFNDPIIFNETGYTMSQAFFANSKFDPDSFQCSTPEDCLSVYNAPFTFFGFGQSNEGDWALNHCIAYHELNHAFVAKFVPDLATYFWSDDYGINSDPGALNEAWADYFAAIHCGVSNFMTGTYNGRPFRNLNNEVTCADFIGQIHRDGLVFSGALWKVRNVIGNESLAKTFDQLIFKAMTLSEPTETMDVQFRRILTLLRTSESLNPYVNVAESEFNRRILSCSREFLYEEWMSQTFTLPMAQITESNVSSLPNPMVISLSSSDWGFSLNWGQLYESPLLGFVDFGYAEIPLQVYVSVDCPLIFVKQNQTGPLISRQEYYSMKETCTQTMVSPTLASGPIQGQSFFSFMDSPGKPRKIYLRPVHQVPADILMKSTNLRIFGFRSIWFVTQWVVSILGLLLCILKGGFWFRKMRLESKEGWIQSLKSHIKMHWLKTVCVLLQFVFWGCMLAAGIVNVAYPPSKLICLNIALGLVLLIGLLELVIHRPITLYWRIGIGLWTLSGFIVFILIITKTDTPIYGHALLYLVYLIGFFFMIISSFITTLRNRAQSSL